MLNIPVGAEDATIKTAYRELAKRYHPDKSGTSDTKLRFIEVNEAYEVLMRRDEYVREAIQRYKAKLARQHRYGTSSGGVSSPRQRAATYADMKFQEFEKTPIYKTATVINAASNYIFITLGVVMVISPVLGYINDLKVAPLEGREAEFHFFPILVGIAFLYGIWYFLIKHKEA